MFRQRATNPGRVSASPKSVVSLPALALLASLLTLAACFVGYDSSWGQAKAAQRRLAAAATPSPIAAANDAGGHPAKRIYRVRFRPNAHYLAQTVNPQEQLEQLVADADGVLSPAVGLHLELDKVEPWSFAADDKLEVALDALRRDDSGQDVDVVVGLIGALPGPTDSLHQVGYAEVLGKHIVLRAASRLGEHDAVDRALADLSEDERERVVRGRRRHRASAVLLHELGHVLGALHESEVASLMHPAYDTKMGGFGDDAISLMRIALDGGDRAAVARAQLEYVRTAPSASWPSTDREQAKKYLEAMSATAGPAPGGAAAATSERDAIPELHGDDRDRFDRAMRSLKAGGIADSYATAQPLFAAYPRSLGVQDLRCELAAVRLLARDALRTECAAYIGLMDAGAAATR
jgi:hypothetical protein